ncbi:XRE family transcriptional regulator [Bosea sp. OK403]|uniref:helix-turn-helix domain-containing protein n=1 Tax=Bosea sp. OK403 TaxID=1855286 RepID=UPI000B81B391|nr:XRE family transcriptional regulator [Bosea sp. OK403]
MTDAVEGAARKPRPRKSATSTTPLIIPDGESFEAKPPQQNGSILLPDAGSGDIELGPKLKQVRLAKSWTLEQASKATGVARSTLSKIENGLMSPTFDILQKVARGLELDIVEFFDNRGSSDAFGRRTITRRGEGRVFPGRTYQHELLCTELVRKRFLPFRAEITARTLSEFSGWVRHEGEEFLLVLAGCVEVHTEFYEPATLNEGDCIYFDSRMGHAVVSTSRENATVVWICSDSDLEISVGSRTEVG